MSLYSTKNINKTENIQFNMTYLTKVIKLFIKWFLASPTKSKAESICTQIEGGLVRSPTNTAQPFISHSCFIIVFTCELIVYVLNKLVTASMLGLCWLTVVAYPSPTNNTPSRELRLAHTSDAKLMHLCVYVPKRT